MEPIKLIAIDEPDTRIREDAFGIGINPKKETFAELIVATVLPPPLFNNGRGNQRFVNALQQERKTFAREIFHFLERSTKLSVSFSGRHPRHALCATYRLDRQGYTTESLAVGEKVIVTPYSYEAFTRLPNFTTIKGNIEVFLHQDKSTRELYSDVQQNLAGEVGITASHLLVFGMMDLINATCSEYAFKQRIPTLRMSHEGRLTFGVHKKAKFTSPLRNARGYVNLTNLLEYLHGEDLIFTDDFLESIGVRFQTV